MKRYNTFLKVNRPIRFWGLSSMQFSIIALFGAIIVIVMVFKRVHPLVVIMILVALVGAFVFLFTKLKEEHKNGNPNYIQGLLVKSNTPKKITDKYRLFKNLIQK